jgi:hypothetical protein
VEFPFPRLFTPDQANALLDELRPLVEDMLKARARVTRLRPSLEPVLEKIVGNGGNKGTEKLYRALERLRHAVLAVQEHGVLVKDINTGLIDFPALREGKAVFLCWRYGEPRVEYWHDLDAGFTGRAPL